MGRADGAAPGAVAVHRVLTPLYEQVRERARRDAVWVDPGRELTDVRKQRNTALNRPRAAVEYAVAHLKSSERASGGPWRSSPQCYAP